jgi:exopolysaccharide biosynthesis polyprenyl glycosylphosphotransferase
MVKPTRVLPSFVLGLVDLALWHSVLFIVFQLRFVGRELHPSNVEAYRNLVLWFSFSLLYLFHTYGLYNRRSEPWETERITLVTALLVHSGALFALAYALGNAAFPRSVLLLSFPIQVLTIGIWRYVVWRISVARTGDRTVVAFGSPQEIKKLADKCAPGGTPALCAVVAGDADTEESLSSIPVLGRLSDLAKLPSVGELWLIMPSVPIADRVPIIERGIELGCDVALVPDLYEIALFNAKFDHYDDVPVLFLGSNRDATSIFSRVKRVLDIVLAAVGLIVAAPVMLVIAVLTWADSGLPILYVQERHGQNGKVFKLRKFRTMRQDAEKHTGPVFATKGDPRVTRLGRFLRQTRLDELPQLYNVLVGDMSLVGPRPERPVFVEQFERSIPGYRQRHGIKPGLTGLAQTVGKYDTPIEDKLRFDLLYAYSRSFHTDIAVMLRTIVTVLRRNAQ